jgi:hypothetical protein
MQEKSTKSEDRWYQNAQPYCATTIEHIYPSLIFWVTTPLAPVDRHHAERLHPKVVGVPESIGDSHQRQRILIIFRL